MEVVSDTCKVKGRGVMRFNDWQLYEQEKKKIDQMAISAGEYEQMIKDLVNRLKI